MLLLSSKVVLLYTFTTFVAAALLVMPLRAVEGAYVDKPICDVCTCKSADSREIHCRKNLPEPARWKDLDSSFSYNNEGGTVGVKLLVSIEDLTTLEKGVFDGLKCEELRINGNPKLESIEQGTFKGLRVSTANGARGSLYISDNPKLKVLKAKTFDGLARANTIFIVKNGIETIEAGTFSGTVGYINKLYVQDNAELTKMESKAFDVFSLSELFIVSNKALLSLEKSTFHRLFVAIIHISANAELASIKAETFKEAIFQNGGGLHITCNPKVTTLVTDTFKGMKGTSDDGVNLNKVSIQMESQGSSVSCGQFRTGGLVTVEKRAFSGLVVKYGDFFIRANPELKIIEAGAFEDVDLSVGGSLKMNRNPKFVDAPAGLFRGFKGDAL